MASAVEQILDVADHGHGRITMFFGLAGGLPNAWVKGSPWPELLSLGRFSRHFESAAQIMPRVVWSELFTDPKISTTSGSDQEEPHEANLTVTVSLAVSPRGDAVLILDYSAANPLPSHELALLLARTCFNRQLLQLNDQFLLEIVVSALKTEEGIETLDWGSHVHQCVWADDGLYTALVKENLKESVELPAPLVDLIYRGTLAPGNTERLGIRTPEALNIDGVAFAAHARGVTVVGGWSPQVQHAIQGTCLTMIISLEVLRRAKLGAFESLGLDEQTALMTAEQARAWVVDLSRRLDNLLLDLSFGVEAYIDSMLIPELVIESYQSSLMTSVRVHEALDNTSRMLDRLSAVINTRSARLEILTQNREEKRERITSLIIAVATLIALPPALLLAFFGINSPNVHPRVSILDLKVYWSAYLLCWLPFTLLTLMAVLLRRRARRSTPNSD